MASGDSELTLSDVDQLEWNQKKQDLILNLGLSTNSETDETPTPTRFIRNCEEVGLFQDLQDVNPFDEMFKKAVENPSSVNLYQHQQSSDDTLHTPQIYPPEEETTSSLAPALSNNTTSTIDDRDDPVMITLVPEKAQTPSSTSRDKLKEALVQKSGSITPVPINKLLDPQRLNTIEQFTQTVLAKEQRSREANRAAQIRCRKRKQKEFEELLTENKLLKNENKTLKALNLGLQMTVDKLKEELKKSRVVNGNNNNNNNILNTKVEPPPNEEIIVPPIVANKKPVASRPPPIAPKKPNNVVFSLPNNMIGVPLQNVQNNNSIVLVCPVASEPIVGATRKTPTNRKLAIRKCR